MAKRRRKRRGKCPCRSGAFYASCCGPFHRNEQIPHKAQDLMRSRYSAYARGLVDYIIETTDRQGAAWEEPVAKWRQSIRQFMATTDFLGVEILAAETDGPRAEVSFLARLRRDGEDVSFRERSEFVLRQGRWLYRQGTPIGEP